MTGGKEGKFHNKKQQWRQKGWSKGRDDTGGGEEGGVMEGGGLDRQRLRKMREAGGAFECRLCVSCAS